MAQNTKKPRRGKTIIAQKLQDLLTRVKALRQRGAIAEALTLLDDYDRAHPDEAIVVAEQLVCHSALGDSVAMLAALERLDALRPDDPATLLHLMNLRQQQGLPVQLLRTTERFLAVAPDHPERAQVQRLRDGTLRALRPSLRGLGLVAGTPSQDQTEPPSLDDVDLAGLRAIEDHEAGTQRLQRGDFRGAAALFEKTLAQLPQFFAARDALALAYLRLGEDDKALAAAAAALADPRRPPVAIGASAVRALALRWLGRDAEAEAALEELRALAPTNVGSAVRLMEALTLAQDPEGVLACARRLRAALPALPKHLETAFFLHIEAAAMLQRGKVPRARQLWEEALLCDPHHVLSRDNLERLKAAPPAERGVVCFQGAEWLNLDHFSELRRIAVADTLDQDLGPFLQQHPALARRLGDVARCADLQLLTSVVAMAGVSGDPLLLAALRGLCAGQGSPLSVRRNAVRALRRWRALPEGPLRLWNGTTWLTIPADPDDASALL